MYWSSLVLALLLFCTEALAGVSIKDQNSSTGAEVNSNNALEVVQGKPSRVTYIASVSGQAATSAYIVSLEADASLGIKIVSICVGTSNATAAAAGTITVQRRTTASSGGTALTAEGTGATAVSKLDPADGNFAGVARLGGTPGTGGAVIDQYGFTVGEIGAGTADPPGLPVFCRDYGMAGSKPIVISAGTSNGVSVNVSAAGAGALNAGSISIVFITE